VQAGADALGGRFMIWYLLAGIAGVVMGVAGIVLYLVIRCK
jgi:hypothetical protein